MVRKGGEGIGKLRPKYMLRTVCGIDTVFTRISNEPQIQMTG